MNQARISMFSNFITQVTMICYLLSLYLGKKGKGLGRCFQKGKDAIKESFHPKISWFSRALKGLISMKIEEGCSKGSQVFIHIPNLSSSESKFAENFQIPTRKFHVVWKCIDYEDFSPNICKPYFPNSVTFFVASKAWNRKTSRKLQSFCFNMIKDEGQFINFFCHVTGEWFERKNDWLLSHKLNRLFNQRLYKESRKFDPFLSFHVMFTSILCGDNLNIYWHRKVPRKNFPSPSSVERQVDNFASLEFYGFLFKFDV